MNSPGFVPAWLQACPGRTPRTPIVTQGRGPAFGLSHLTQALYLHAIQLPTRELAGIQALSHTQSGSKIHSLSRSVLLWLPF